MRAKNAVITLAISFFLLLQCCILSTAFSSKQNVIKNVNCFSVSKSELSDYTKIQDAIDNASKGDTIYVYNGTYFENLHINKSINLIGEDKKYTIIDGNNQSNTITINAENVIVGNFTITGAQTDDFFHDPFRSGIRIVQSNNKIENNIIKNNRLGVFGFKVTNLTIKNNLFIDDGITFASYENEDRYPNKIDYFTHVIENNTIDGKPLKYYINEKDKVITGEMGQLIMVNCTNLTIKDITTSHTDNGILMAFCSECLIENCTSFANDGVWTFNSNRNVFRFNNFSNNYLHGITLDYSSNFNIIEKNTFYKNVMMGVMLEYYSKKNTISYNNFLYNNLNPNTSYLSQAFSMQAFRNKFTHNYWSDWIGLKNEKLSFLPKIVLGCPIERFSLPLMFTFDFYPSKEPYNFAELI